MAESCAAGELLLALKGVSISPAEHVRYRPAPQKSCREVSVQNDAHSLVVYMPQTAGMSLSICLAKHHGGLYAVAMSDVC